MAVGSKACTYILGINTPGGLGTCARKVTVPVVASILSLWLARVPAAYLLAHFFGPMNIHFCYAIGWALGLAICVPYYFSGRWKEKSVVARTGAGG